MPRRGAGRKLAPASLTLLVALALTACGGGSSSSSQPAKVGDCIDAQKQVVDCSSSSAQQKLVSDQSAPNAIACVQIGENPQVQVKVGSGTFCAQAVTPGSTTATTGTTGTTGSSQTQTQTSGSSTTGSTTGSLTAPGGGLPATVAVAAGAPISRGVLLHWMEIAARGQSSQGAGGAIVPDDPPTFANCISEVRSHNSKLANAPAAQLEADCEQLFKTLSAEALDFLIKSHWYLADGTRQGLMPTSAEVNQALVQERMHQFPKVSAFIAYLKRTGQTPVDLLYRVRVSLVARRLAEKHPSDQSAVDREVRRLYLAGTRCAAIVAMRDCGNFH